MIPDENKKQIHLHAVLFREAKIILSNYELYLKDRITSKELAQKMLSLRDIIQKIEDTK